ncbi:MAG: helix-turn-helix transcriptional regulator [Clostridia bacterium]|nr:helix-turn-helix transcriptional regulator [Clostridia bacterium]
MEQKRLTTGALLNRIFASRDFSCFVRENRDALHVASFQERVAAHLQRTGMTKEQLIAKSGVERVYGYQLLSGVRAPGRDKVVQLCIGLGLDVEESQHMLSSAQKPALYPRIERDAALLFAISNHYDIFQTQELLHERGATLLGERKE